MFFAKMEEQLINEHKREIKYKVNNKRKSVKIMESNILSKPGLKNNINIEKEIK